MNGPLPPRPSAELLADLSREAAAIEGVEPALVEKDFYLTRLLWALALALEDKALLKGGTLLSKVDLGFFRMSEDVDLVVPGEPSRFKSTNAGRMKIIRSTLREAATLAGLQLPFPGGTSFENGAHAVWELPYESHFGRQAIRVEASLRPAIRTGRHVRLRQLLKDSLLGDYSQAACWALDEDEARAEKVRAACTREAIRDFYDLDRLLDAGKDFTSKTFTDLVDIKLRELNAPPLRQLKPAPFGLTDGRLKKLKFSEKRELPIVLRASAPSFSLGEMLRRFETLWAG